VALESINALIAADMASVDGAIRAHLTSDVVLVRQVSEYIINSGGKRLRPKLLILAAQACGYTGPHHHVLAAVIEFIHTATLLHDDVVDESELRRGQKTANALFGNAASVLVGDFVYSRAFQMMVAVNEMRVLEVLADATNHIASGEVLQLLNVHDPDIDEEGYLRVIRLKTARLFEASTRLGAILAGTSHELEEDMARYGTRLGTAFQLIDDVLDYSGDWHETGKNVGDDLAEGKPTLPLIYVIRNGTPAQAELVRRAIEQGGIEDLPAVIETVRDSGALDYTRAAAHREAKAACDALALLPDSQQKEALIELTEFAVGRTF
jgi:octaprenyl-diphosphate synthase